MIKFSIDPDHRLDTGIVFWIGHYWEIWKLYQLTMLHNAAVQGIHWQVSPTSLHHRSTTDSGIVVTILVRRALAEVCIVPVLLVVVS